MNLLKNNQRTSSKKQNGVFSATSNLPKLFIISKFDIHSWKFISCQEI